MPNKKVSIARNILDSTGIDGTYKIRYRILSNNQKIYSDWSPYTLLTPPQSISTIASGVTPTYSYTSPNVTATWTIPSGKSLYMKTFHIYVSYYSGSWGNWSYSGSVPIYSGDTQNINFSYTFAKSGTKARIAVFAATDPKLTSTQIANSGTSGNAGNINKLFVDTTGISTP